MDTEAPDTTATDPTEVIMATTGTLTLAKGCQSVFVAPSGSPTPVTIPCTVTSNIAAPKSVVANNYTVTVTLRQNGLPVASGSQTYPLAGSGVQTSGVVQVVVTVPAGKFGNFQVTGVTSVVFSDDPAAKTATGDTVATVLDPNAAAAQLVIKNTELAVKQHRKSDRAKIVIEVTNNHPREDAFLELSLDCVPLDSQTIRPGHTKKLKSHEPIVLENPGAAIELIFRLKGTMGAEPVDCQIGAAYCVIG